LSQSSFADFSARAFQAIIKNFSSSLSRAEPGLTPSLEAMGWPGFSACVSDALIAGRSAYRVGAAAGPADARTVNPAGRAVAGTSARLDRQLCMLAWAGQLVQSYLNY
jgi:hypothetical protein